MKKESLVRDCDIDLSFFLLFFSSARNDIENKFVLESTED